MPEFDNYVISSVLGEGGMGIVFLAEDRRTSLPVAIKVMSKSLDDPELSKRFMKENQILSSLNHRNIVRCYDVTQSREGLPSIVMEYLRGVDFGSFEGRPYPELLPLMIQASMGLAYLKERGILHRDLSSNNVLVTLSNQRRLVKILDFGVAKLLHEGTNEELTRTGEFLGKLAYASPELLMMTGCDWRSDIYSLGVIFYRLLTKERPIKVDNARNYLSWVNAHQVDQVFEFSVPEGNLAVPERLQRIVKKMLARSPEDRPQAYEEIIEEIVKVQKRAQADGLEPDTSVTSSLPGQVPEGPPGSSPGSGSQPSDVPLVSVSPTPGGTVRGISVGGDSYPTDAVTAAAHQDNAPQNPDDGFVLHSGGGLFQEMVALDLPKRTESAPRHPMRTERTGTQRVRTAPPPAVVRPKPSKALPIGLALVVVIGGGLAAAWHFMGRPSPSALTTSPSTAGSAPARPPARADAHDIPFAERNLTQENLEGITSSGLVIGTEKKLQLTLTFKKPVNAQGLKGIVVVHARTADGKQLPRIEGDEAKPLPVENSEATQVVRFEIPADPAGTLHTIELQIGPSTLTGKVTRR